MNFIPFAYFKDLYRNHKDVITYLEYEISKSIYHYGAHFAYPKENYSLYYTYKSYILFFGIYSIRYIILFLSFFYKKNTKKNTIVSNAYMSNGKFTLSGAFKDLGFETIKSPRSYSTMFKDVQYKKVLLDTMFSIDKKIKSSKLNTILNQDFFQEVNGLKKHLREFFAQKEISALFLPNDLGFYERMAIDICKELGKPTFLFLHGLPGRYNRIDDNRTDYLIVWGDTIKQNYVDIGFDPNKIFVSGHPGYIAHSGQQELRFGMQDILIITKGVNGSPTSGEEIIMSDRGNLLSYLYSIENVLKTLGVKNVRLRPHPGESKEWYTKNINNDFFQLDTDFFLVSLQKSSLVIGPTSSVLLEAIYHGVNYIIYEPSIDNKDLYNRPLVNPIDGTNEKVPVAHNEAMLTDIINNKKMVDPSFLSDYIQPYFDISFLKKLLV